MRTKMYMTVFMTVFSLLAACSNAGPEENNGQPPVTPSEPPVELGDFVQIGSRTFTMSSPAEER